jgi:hypothetical protein
MNINKKLCVFLTILGALSLNACSHHKLEKGARYNNLPAVASLNEEGKLIVLNSKNGTKVSPCIKQNTEKQYDQVNTKNNICEISIREENGQKVAFKNGKRIELPVVTVDMVAFPGSHCVAHVSGTQYEICWPW